MAANAVRVSERWNNTADDAQSTAPSACGGSEKFVAEDKLRQEALDTFDVWEQVASGLVKRAAHTAVSEASSLAKLVVPGSPPGPKERRDWVVAINIGVGDYGAGDNVAMRLHQLEKLAPLTERHNVSFLVQVPVADVGSKAMPTYSQLVSHPYHLNRYLISDGKMKQIATVNSESFAADVRGLLALSTTMFKADRLGYFNDSHGNGTKGLTGDTGSSSLKEFASAIREFKLSALNFDSCLMAQTSVLSALQSAVPDVVASAQTESAVGQDLVAPLTYLIEHPKATGSELSEKIIETARRQTPVKTIARAGGEQDDSANAGEKKIQVTTLAHFDLRKYKQFESNLNTYGEALSKLDAESRKALHPLVDSLNHYGNTRQWRRDFVQFTDGVAKLIESKAIHDPDGSVKAATDAMRNSIRDVIKSYSGFEQFKNSGGLSIFIPRLQMLEEHSRAMITSPAGDIADISSQKRPLRGIDRAVLGDDVNEIQGELEDDATEHRDTQAHIKDASKIAASISEAVEQLYDKRDDPQGSEALKKQLHELAAQFQKTEYYKGRLPRQVSKMSAEIDRELAENEIDSSKGWGKFLNSFRSKGH